MAPIAFVGLMATEISKVLRGEDSFLFSKDFWGLIYVGRLVAGFGWGRDDSGWRLHVWELGDYRWGAGGAVFSGN